MKTPQPPLGHCLFLNDKCVAMLQKSVSGALGSFSNTNIISLPMVFPKYMCVRVGGVTPTPPPLHTDSLCIPASLELTV